jgi:hypothetical protein
MTLSLGHRIAVQIQRLPGQGAAQASWTIPNRKTDWRDTKTGPVLLLQMRQPALFARSSRPPPHCSEIDSRPPR